MRIEEKVQQRHSHTKASSFWCPVRAMQTWSWALSSPCILSDRVILRKLLFNKFLGYVEVKCRGKRMSFGHLTWSHTGWELDGDSTQVFWLNPQPWTFLWNATPKERDDYTEFDTGLWYEKWSLIPCLKDSFKVVPVILEGSRHTEV